MLPINIKAKVSLYLLGVLSLAMVVFTVSILKHRQEDLQQVAARHVTQLTNVIVASTRYGMLINRRDLIERIIEDVAQQTGIQSVRVIGKSGHVVHSNRAEEIGRPVSQKDEPCVQCHEDTHALTNVPEQKLWKIYTGSDGRRMLGAMHVIRNEPTCSSAACHEHAKSQSVLGVVDVAYSLDEMDRTERIDVLYIVSASAAFILLLSVGAALFLRRLIYEPIQDLELGARNVAAGNLEQVIPVRSEDEFGRVAVAFNQMTVSLRASQAQTQELVSSLEMRVAERTRDLLAAKAEVAQGEKLASIGMLASGIAHELNNPLTGVLTFTSLLRRKMPEGSEDAQDLDLVIRETKRCASIIRRLLDFAREKVPVKGYFNLNQVVQDTIRFVERPVALQQIDVVPELDATLPEVWGDADLLKQVVLNLLVNAQQAIEGRGRIVVRTRLTPPNVNTSAAATVELSVADNGCGIPAAHLERIFDPFFTSKDVGKGTGLGLSVSYGIVKAHGGRILVDSVLGEGSTFHVILPVSAAESPLAPPGTEVLA